MSSADGELEIRSGGVIAVDTEDLRAAAARLTLIADDCDRVRGHLQEASAILADAGIWVLPPAAAAERTGTAAAELADGLRRMADTYELVELTAAARAARTRGDADLLTRLESRMDRLLAADPWTWWRAVHAEHAWHAARLSALAGHLDPLHGFAADGGAGLLLAAVLIGAVGLGGRGTVGPRASLEGPARPVSLSVLRRERTAAPASVAALARRMPGDGRSRIRVERYTMADGTRRFVAYAAGTQSVGIGSDDVADMTSNLDLYGGTRSASYDAIMAALSASGAERGDPVDLVGYSQGAMGVSHVALSEWFDVPTLITFGSPVQADVGADTLSVTVTHSDDLVRALAAGGLAAGTGAAGSFVVERTIDRPRQVTAPFGTHELDEYTETARMLDSSTDPRMDAVRERLAELGDAETAEVLVYGAERSAGPDRVAGGGGIAGR